ncbi:MAG: glycosyltransferase family 4 protein [Pseudomonadota bacterium]
MKVLHVEAGRHLYGGARQALYLLEGLHAQGVRNVLVCPPGAAIAAPARDFALVEELPLGGDLDLGMLWRLHAALGRHRPDLMHLHSRRGADIWGGLAAAWARVPCVLSRRVDNPEPRWLAGIKYRLYDRVVTISEGIRQVLLAEGVPDEKVTCVRSAVDGASIPTGCDRATFLRTFDLPEGATVIGVIAQLIPRKGHRYLFAAMPRLRDRHPGLRVVLFGQGPLEAELRAQVQAQGLQKEVVFAGFRTDLANWLSCLDLVVHPADIEGLGVSLLQAALAGVPVIATRAGGMPEAVEEGVTGLLVDPGDVTGLQRAIERLLDDVPLRQALGRQGRARMLAEFSVQAMVAGNLAVYRSLS